VLTFQFGPLTPTRPTGVAPFDPTSLVLLESPHVVIGTTPRAGFNDFLGNRHSSDHLYRGGLPAAIAVEAGESVTIGSVTPGVSVRTRLRLRLGRRRAVIGV